MVPEFVFRPLIRWMPVAGLLCCGGPLFGQSLHAVSAQPVSLAERSVPGETIASWPADPWMMAVQERRIFAVLQQPWDGPDFAETPLTQAVSEFERASGLPFDIDQRALEYVGLKVDAEVTAQLQGTSLGMALRKTLRDLDLVFQIAGGVVTITSPEAAEESLVIRVYDVTPLVAEPVAISGGRYRGRNSLLDLIQMSVEPDIWERLGGPSTIAPRRLGSRAVLVIPTTSEVHFQIIALLNRLNQVGYAGADPSRVRRAADLPPRPSRGQTPEQISSSNSQLPRFGQ